MTRPDRRVIRRAAFVPVESKLRRPVRPGPLVDRPRLVRWLRGSAGVPRVHVVAPPGYGKTVLVSQWAGRDPRPFAWLSADEGDDDARSLATYLFLALHRVEPFAADALAGLDAGPEPPVAVATARIAAELPRRDPFVLVVENAERLRSPAAREIVGAVAAYLPPGAQLVLVARGLPLPDADVEGAVVRVTADHLRFTDADARALVDALGLQSGGEELDAVVERTEGWPVAIYLATQETSWERAVPVLADYLRHEMLGLLPPDDADFLIRTSVVDDLSAPLCDALLATTGSDRRLQRLAETTLLLHPAPPGDRFRLNAALRDVLRAELVRQRPLESPRLHAAAASWFEAAGDLAHATAHALEAHDVPRAARLVWAQTPLLVAAGQVGVVQERLDGFGPRLVSTNAHLALSAAWRALARGDAVDHWLAAAERGDYDEDRQGEAESVAAAVAVARGLVAADGVEQMIADAQLATRLLDPADALGCTAHLLVAIGTYLTGAVEQADAMLAVTAKVARACAAHDVEAVALAERALIALDRGETEVADAHAAAAEDVIEAHDLGSLATVLPARCVTAAFSARRGAPAAAADTDRAAGRVRETAELSPWSAVQCRYVLARAYLDLGDPAAARVLLSEAQGRLDGVADAPLLHETVARAWRRVQMHPTEGTGAATLTAAELRVLRFLPTYLSFEEIGSRLYLSRNTVKTQAVAAYRKLGVSSRSEAVERGYALGLIAPETFTRKG